MLIPSSKIQGTLTGIITFCNETVCPSRTGTSSKNAKIADKPAKEIAIMFLTRPVLEKTGINSAPMNGMTKINQTNIEGSVTAND